MHTLGGFDPKLRSIRLSGAPPFEPVGDFDPERYCGRWYEIARIDHPFEEGLSHVTADYQLQDDKTVSILNRGYDDQKGKWRDREGVAVLSDEGNVGTFGVTFYPPYSAVYNVIALDHDGYQWAMVATDGMDKLWILSRQSTLDQIILRGLLERAGRMGFDVRRLTWTGQG